MLHRTGSLTVVALLVASAAHVSLAQGGMGGGGGGMGRGGGMGGDRPRFDGGGEAIANRFEEMAELKPVLEKLDLSRPQKDSLRKVEDYYKRALRGYGKAARDFLSRGREGMDSIPRLVREAASLRNEEWAAVRAYLPSDMHAQLDDNFAKVREADRNRLREQRDNMGAGMGGTGAGMGGMGGRGGMRGRGGMGPPGGDDRGSARGLTTEELANRFEQMGELRNVLVKLDLSPQQRDSIGKIELAYGNRLRDLARTVRSFATQGRPPVDSLRALQQDANTLRYEEWAAVRAYLPEAMRPRFDANTDQVRDDEARRRDRLP